MVVFNYIVRILNSTSHKEIFMIVINFLLAMLPIFWLMVALAGLKMPGFKA